MNAMGDTSSNYWLFIVSAVLFANFITVCVVYVLRNLFGKGSRTGGVDRGKQKRRDRAARTTTLVDESLNSVVHFAMEARRNNFVNVGRPSSIRTLDALLKDTEGWDFDGAGEIKDSLTGILQLLREWDGLVQKDSSVPVERVDIFIQRLEQSVLHVRQNLEAVRRLAQL